MKKKLFSFFAVIAYNLLTAQMSPKGLDVGAEAPNFNAKDQYGKTVALNDLVKKGPVVLIFYRGEWCPYCNKQLSELNDSIPMITAKGARVIAITPENAMNVEKTVKKTKASYSIVSDNNIKIMADYKVNYILDPETASKYKNYGIDLNEKNGTNGTNLPVPTVYIVDRSGKIKYKHLDEDFTKRTSVMEIIDHL
jgi:peroxiredoxin